MPAGFGGDHATLFHEDLGCKQPALTVLVVDQRKPALILGGGLLAMAALIGVDQPGAQISERKLIDAVRGATSSISTEIGGAIADGVENGNGRTDAHPGDRPAVTAPSEVIER